MNVIFFGGLSRAGKSAFWPLFNSLEFTDQIQNLAELDWFNTAYLEGKINQELYLELVKVKVDLSSWSSYLGRYLNSNINDRSNFSRLRSKEEYLERISREDTEQVFLEYQYAIKNNKFIPVFYTDIKLTLEQQKEIGLNIHHIHLLRNPCRMYNEWIKTERVARNRQPASRMMKPKKQIKDDLSVENETADIVIEDHLLWIEKESTIKFEDYCLNPESVMSNIAKKCGLKLLPFENKKIQDANVPRDISAEYSLSLLSSKNLSDDRIIKLNELQNNYLSKIANQGVI
mgnify:CR=1 FL=1|tara:strand:- start:2535 stop:3398 length:864 start_codon:yes stop_codon:yes gene_type:complete